MRTLKGLIPICAHCKNVRDDDGFRQQVDAYVTEHSEAHLTHGICPACTQKYFPELRGKEPNYLDTYRDGRVVTG